MKFVLVAFTLAFITDANACFGQKRVTYISHATLSGRPRDYTLIDSASGTRYALDSTRIFITAINKTGKELWKTDPWKDNKLEEYRVKRPVIARFYFNNYYYGDSIIYVDKLKHRKAKEIENNKKKYSREVIWITYNNTQFGIIEKATGRFSWFGQD